jgi:hypothetical protein
MLEKIDTVLGKRKTKPTQKLLESKLKIKTAQNNQDTDKENIAPKNIEPETNKKLKTEDKNSQDTIMDICEENINSNEDSFLLGIDELESEEFLGSETPTSSGITSNEDLSNIYLDSPAANGEAFAFTPGRDFGDNQAPNSLSFEAESDEDMSLSSPISLTQVLDFFESPEEMDIEVQRQHTPEFGSPISTAPTEIASVIDTPDSDVLTELDTVLDTPDSDVPTELDTPNSESDYYATLNYSQDANNFESINGTYYYYHSSNSSSSSQDSLSGLSFTFEMPFAEDHSI